MSRCWTWSLLLGVVAGCASPEGEDARGALSSSLSRHTGHALGPDQEPGHASLPEGVSLDDGISEEDAVAIALWNNAAFREALADLGFARADLLEAGLLQNPVFSILFPTSDKLLEATLVAPLESLLLRSSRRSIAELQLKRVTEQLVHHGLDLVRDVRVAHTDLIEAQLQAGFSEDVAEAFERRAAVFAAQLEAGAISPLAAQLSDLDTREARREARRREAEIGIARGRFLELLGGDELTGDSEPVSADLSVRPAPPVSGLLELAYACRPESSAAELGLEESLERAGLAKGEFLKLAGMLDANEQDDGGLEIGPGLQLEIPLFDRNQAGRARSDAAVERAAHHYVHVHDLITREVRQAAERYAQALGQLEATRQHIVPGIEKALAMAEKAYAAGQTSRIPMVETEIRLLRTRESEASSVAALRRAHHELERSVGRRLGAAEDS